MKRYERILVCVDQADGAERMAACAQAIARLADAKEIHLLHVSAEEESGQEGEAGGVPSGGPVTEGILNALIVEQFEQRQQAVCSSHIVRGVPLMEILRFAHDREVDLIIIGRHRSGADVGEEALLARRVTRKATCSVLVLPDEFHVQANTIVVPVRNSDCSAGALDVACGMASAIAAQVIALNVFQVAAGYSRVGTSFEEHVALLAAAAKHECDKLLTRVDARGVQVTRKCAADLQHRPVPVIIGVLEEVGADLVVIGARGRTGAAGVLLGTVTEQLIRSSPVPVLAVKKKGECLGILRALFALAGEG